MTMTAAQAGAPPTPAHDRVATVCALREPHGDGKDVDLDALGSGHRSCSVSGVAGAAVPERHGDMR